MSFSIPVLIHISRNVVIFIVLNGEMKKCLRRGLSILWWDVIILYILQPHPMPLPTVSSLSPTPPLYTHTHTHKRYSVTSPETIYAGNKLLVTSPPCLSETPAADPSSRPVNISSTSSRCFCRSLSSIFVLFFENKTGILVKKGETYNPMDPAGSCFTGPMEHVPQPPNPNVRPAVCTHLCLQSPGIKKYSQLCPHPSHKTDDSKW